MELTFEKVAADAFLDELKNILGGMEAGAREKIASSFSPDAIAAMLKEAGFFDRLKGFAGGGMQNGIPMQSLGQQLAGSNPFSGMGSSLASSARAAGGAVAGRLQGAGQAISQGAGKAMGAVGGFLRGGTNAQGIPMQGLGQQLAGANPFQGMGASLGQSAHAAMGGIGRLMGGGGGGAQPAMGHA